VSRRSSCEGGSRAQPEISQTPQGCIALRFVEGIGSIIAMDLKEVMAVNLRRLRHAKKMTQEELAERAGLSARYVGGIERADVSASVTVLGRIADALEVEAHELVRAAPANARKKAAVGP
jgi:DNA-binding XRE family transcriptional regulator